MIRELCNDVLHISRYFYVTKSRYRIFLSHDITNLSIKTIWCEHFIEAILPNTKLMLFARNSETKFITIYFTLFSILALNTFVIIK